MNAFEISIVSILSLGVITALYVLLRNPIGFTKDLLRSMKASRSNIAIILFFIWAPIWVVDKVFGLKIFIATIEEASSEETIDFTDFNKFILVSSDDRNLLENIISEVYNINEPDFYCDLSDAKFGFSNWKKQTIIKITGEIDFESFKTLIFYIDNAAKPPMILLVKGVLINKNNPSKSLYFYNSWEPEFKLIGRNSIYRKIYVEVGDEDSKRDRIFYNTNLDITHNLSFSSFEKYVNDCSFNEILLPRT